MDDDAMAAVRRMESIGVQQFEQFRTQRIVERVLSIDDTISKNNLRNFKTCNTKGRGKSKSVTKDLKIHIQLFSQMYIATQIRGGDVKEFFKQETRKYPPSLTKDGEMRSGDKADSLPSLRALKSPDSSCTNADAAACIEGSVVVNMTTPAKNQTFQDIARTTLHHKLTNTGKNMTLAVLMSYSIHTKLIV